MIVYLARDIAAFVMYCVNGESGSSLLIESTNSMIYEESFLFKIIFMFKKLTVGYALPGIPLISGIKPEFSGKA